LQPHREIAKSDYQRRDERQSHGSEPKDSVPAVAIRDAFRGDEAKIEPTQLNAQVEKNVQPPDVHFEGS
jgi:hypothetical protein